MWMDVFGTSVPATTKYNIFCTPRMSFCPQPWSFSQGPCSLVLSPVLVHFRARREEKAFPAWNRSDANTWKERCRAWHSPECPSSRRHESCRLQSPLGDGAHARKHLVLGQGCQEGTVFQPPPNLPEEPALLSLALVFRMWYWLWPSPLPSPIILASFHNPWFQFDFVYKVVCCFFFFFWLFVF